MKEFENELIQYIRLKNNFPLPKAIQIVEKYWRKKIENIFERTWLDALILNKPFCRNIFSIGLSDRMGLIFSKINSGGAWKIKSF